MPLNYQPRKKGPGRRHWVFHKGKPSIIVNPAGSKLAKKVYEKTIGMGVIR